MVSCNQQPQVKTRLLTTANVYTSTLDVQLVHHATMLCHPAVEFRLIEAVLHGADDGGLLATLVHQMALHGVVVPVGFSASLALKLAQRRLAVPANLWRFSAAVVLHMTCQCGVVLEPSRAL